MAVVVHEASVPYRGQSSPTVSKSKSYVGGAHSDKMYVQSSYVTPLYDETCKGAGCPFTPQH